MAANAPKDKEILLDALERPEGERDTFVRAACGDDTALRARVGDLLRMHAEAGSSERLAGKTRGEGGEGNP